MTPTGMRCQASWGPALFINQRIGEENLGDIQTCTNLLIREGQFNEIFNGQEGGNSLEKICRNLSMAGVQGFCSLVVLQGQHLSVQHSTSATRSLARTIETEVIRGFRRSCLPATSPGKRDTTLRGGITMLGPDA